MADHIDLLDIDSLRPHFRHVYLTRIDAEANARRWYYIGWRETLFGKAVVRSYGRLGSDRRRVLAPVAFDCLDAAWPLIRKTLRTRLRHGYVIVDDAAVLTDAEPVIRMTFNAESKRPVVELEQMSLADVSETLLSD